MDVLTDSEAKFLKELEKIVIEHSVEIPRDGNKECLNLARNGDINDNIMRIHITTSKRNKEKCSFNVVYNKSITIFRIDIGGSRIHINPDGEDIPTPHMHIYRDGFDAKFAIPLPSCFTDSNNFGRVLYDLLGYSNVVNRDSVEITYQGVLFNG